MFVDTDANNSGTNVCTTSAGMLIGTLAVGITVGVILGLIIGIACMRRRRQSAKTGIVSFNITAF